MVVGLLILVITFYYRRLASFEPMHKTACNIPMHPGRNELLLIRQNAIVPLRKGQVLPYALGIFKSDGRLGECIVKVIANKAHKGPHPFNRQGFPKAHDGAMRASV